MCGIAGVIALDDCAVDGAARYLQVMNDLLSHRGPDGEGVWLHGNGHVGLAHRRLSIIDLESGQQPMTSPAGNVVTYNGEIYNYLELREQLKPYPFRTSSDTEVLLAAYEKWGTACVDHLQGMFAFAIWDERKNLLFCARDRFGIKPFYYTVVGQHLYLASEPKALLPFMPEIATDIEGLKEYIIFQLCLDGRTLFKNIHQLRPGQRLIVQGGTVREEQYWEVFYDLEWGQTPKYFEDQLRELIGQSVALHLRSDVPVGAYLSGGADSGIMASLASQLQGGGGFAAFSGRFDNGPLYDESRYAKAVADKHNMDLHQVTIGAGDFIDSIRKVIYHLDYPVAGPGSFPQYHVSQLAAQHRKVVLGGQGGDEIFGGYVRYLLAYFEQCIRGAIDGTLQSGNFVVTYESIIPNLVALQNYQPMIKEFWREGLFEPLDRRYYRLVNRSASLAGEINWDVLGDYSPFDTFSKIFNATNVGSNSYFDRMTHFDFKTLLPGLLQVEDRMSMAHGLESRVPFLYNPLIEFAAKIPADIKFKDGTLKKILIDAMKDELPELVVNRKDKMGFPVPLNDWVAGELKEFVFDLFHASAADRPYFHREAILAALNENQMFSRKLWGLMSLELWHQEFHDQAGKFKKLVNNAA